MKIKDMTQTIRNQACVFNQTIKKFNVVCRPRLRPSWLNILGEIWCDQ